MNRFTKIMQEIHKILGTLLSILFVVWFLSGLVMIYHTYPRVSPADRRMRMDLLSCDSLPAIDALVRRLPAGEPISNLTLQSYLGQAGFQARTRSGTHQLWVDSLREPMSVDSLYIRSVAMRWNPAAIASVDTLYSLDQWIPFGRLKEEFPIYKFHYADPGRHQLYVSSKSGEVLQYTDKQSRFWAWLGAIPHWIYFTSLRQDVERWSDVVVWLSGIGCVMCLAGYYLGIRELLLARRRRRYSLYKKFWYKWHHLMGLIFGIPVFTFCFSGMMSLARVQDWGLTPKLPTNPVQELRKKAPAPSCYPLDYRKVLESYPNQIRQIEWGSFGNIPFYKLYTDQGELIIDARDPHELSPLNLKADEIRWLLSECHKREAIQIEWLEEYDTYYLSRKHKLELPVWKVSVDDVDNSCYYINPRNGQCRYVNTPSRWNHWMYPALHSLNIRLLVGSPWLWNLVMWGTMLGGTFVSISGFVLAIQYVRRKLKNKR